MSEPRAQTPIILAYHRIAEPDIDPWGLAVAPDRFEEQLAVLRDTREPFSMSAFLDRLERGTLPANAVAVTFDDGYVDNLRAAKPRLERAGIPASVFIATGYGGGGREFWWDELARIILECRSAIDCDVSIGGKRHRLRLRPPLRDAAGTPWNDWRHPRTERERTYIKVWTLLRETTSVEREAALSMLRIALESGPADPEDIPMTAEEIGELTSGGLIEIGAHTKTHPHLTTLPPVEMRREIAISKSECEQLIGRPIEGFAYPYGAYDDGTRAGVRDAGFRYACSIRKQFVDVNRFDKLALPRLKVMNWDADAFEQALVALNGKARKPKPAAKSHP